MIWKTIPGHPNYEVSDQGEVRSIPRSIIYSTGAVHLHPGKVLSQFVLRHGYKTTHLGAKHPNKYIHHLVAQVFLGKRPKGMDICHINGDKLDNRLVNLRYGGRAANMFDAVRNRYERAWLEHAENSRRRPRTLAKRTRR